MIKLGLLASLIFNVILDGQMAVTTFGSTDAGKCYEAARDDFSTDWESCNAALKTAGLTSRDVTATRVNRGIIYNRTGKLDEALADFNQAIASDSKLAEAFLNRGNTYFLMRRYDEAISDYEASLRYELTKAHVAWYNIGLAHEARNDIVKAREAYRMSLDINPDFGPAQKKLGTEARPEG